MEDRRAGGAVEVFWSGDGFFPEFAPIEIVAEEAVGTEVGVEAFVIGSRGGSGGGVEVVGGLDGDFGRSATPEEAAGFRVECESDEAVGLESGEEELVAGNDRGRMTGGDGDFPGEIVGRNFSGWFGVECDAGTVGAAKAGPGGIGGGYSEEKRERYRKECSK